MQSYASFAKTVLLRNNACTITKIIGDEKIKQRFHTVVDIDDVIPEGPEAWS